MYIESGIGCRRVAPRMRHKKGGNVFLPIHFILLGTIQCRTNSTNSIVLFKFKFTNSLTQGRHEIFSKHCNRCWFTLWCRSSFACDLCGYEWHFQTPFFCYTLARPKTTFLISLPPFLKPEPSIIFCNVYLHSINISGIVKLLTSGLNFCSYETQRKNFLYFLN